MLQQGLTNMLKYEKEIKGLMQFLQTTELLKDIFNFFFCLSIILKHEWHNFLQKLYKSQNIKPCEVRLGGLEHNVLP